MTIGNALLVPVEIGTIGTLPIFFATNLFVPSPPRTKTQSHSKLFISSAARSVCSAPS